MTNLKNESFNMIIMYEYLPIFVTLLFFYIFFYEEI